MSLPDIGEGRFIPCLIINADKTSDISDLIKYHQNTPPGDALQQWGRPVSFFSTTTVFLHIDFTQPMKVEFSIAFDVEKQYSLVEGIMQSRAFFLQVGQYGDKVSNFKLDKILIEVPELGFDKTWESILTKSLKSKFKKKKYSNKDANQLTINKIKEIKSIWNLNFKTDK